MAEHILLVDDEKPLVEIIKYNLEREGFRVTPAYDGVSAIKSTKEEQYDLIILDIMLPELNGFQVCEEIRKDSAVPILMLTAKDEELDKVRGLELGADDYVTKPFSPRELTARVRAILRRSQITASVESEQSIRFGDLLIDLSGFQVHRKDQQIDLTAREFELLKFFATQPGQVFSREILLEKVWGYEHFGDVRTVDVTIRRLREKIEDSPSEPQYILTKRGVGYYFPKG